MNEGNVAKLDLGRTLNDNPLANDCHNYGSVSGCDAGCPVLVRGECKIPFDAADNLTPLEWAEIAPLYEEATP